MTRSFTCTRRVLLQAGAAAATLTIAAPRLARAQTVHEIQMLNQDPDNPRLRMVFSPRILVAQPGDMVKYVAVDRAHNTQSTQGMLPAGVEGWNGRVNEEVELTLESPGFYGYQCTPHLTLGMVGLIIVEGDGMDANLEEARAVRHRGRAQAAWDEIWEEVTAMGLAA